MISVTLTNPEAVAKLIKALEQKVGLPGLQLVLRSFGEYMYNSIQANFDAEGRPAKWAPLKSATIRAWLYRRKTWIARGRKPFAMGLVGPWRIPLTKAGTAAWAGIPGQPGGRKILTDTGALRASVHYKLLGRNILAIRAGGQAAPYAAVHQFGSKKKGIPARPYLLVQPEDWAIFTEELKNYLTEL